MCEQVDMFFHYFVTFNFSLRYPYIVLHFISYKIQPSKIKIYCLKLSVYYKIDHI